ncbi:MAG TPA: 50S ribosomal protein L10 [Candidatus Fimenecus excrementigallinarum]|uniref:Large ribosomal subunit protein uL10 n=1 Tax=Candidatus Fimenecus excrementigallinarum TaxID=2840816 RepID=A0A9D1IGV5_9FIRM|nr:50S ribosomal protein L10 [Candidatus Fimenecus excrementigallinarum]
MPSEKVLELKKQQVADLKTRLDGACAGVLVDYRGISVADDTQLRKELREAGVTYTVSKNTLLHLAFAGTPYEALDSVLEGTTAIATSADDYVAAARILGKFADKSDSFNLKGGFIDDEVIDLAKLQSLAKLPSREVLLATVLSAFNAPMAAFARVIQAVVDKGGEAPAAEEAAVPAAEEAAPAAEEAAAPAAEEAAAPAAEETPAE